MAHSRPSQIPRGRLWPPATALTATTDPLFQQLATELAASSSQVACAVALLDGGATVPFIARYRKEATGGLDDIQLRLLETRLAYLRELALRRAAVLKSVAEQGKLTPELQAAIGAAPTKQELEDLYLPFKPRRRSKGLIAREAGLEPLADLLFGDPGRVPLVEAVADLNAGAGFADAATVLDGVRDLLAERWAEDASLVGPLREWLWREGLFQSRLADGKAPELPDHAKFRDYFDYSEPISRVPSHRCLAVFRARALEIVDAKLVLPEADDKSLSLAEGRIAVHLRWRHAQRPADDLIRKTVVWTWKVKLSLSLERELFARLREAAEAQAIQVFAGNLRDLLLAAPAGKRVVMGLDPGIRTGVKAAIVSDTGKLLATQTVYPHEPRRDWDGALHTLAQLCRAHGVTLIAIGNGTASRETDKLAGEVIQGLGDPPQIDKVVVSEAGASVYSASEFASQELPELDVSLRGAVSIARRLQDPLAELVKIDPKSIGVGQYQHDVNQSELARMLDTVVEDCVNTVGVDLNTASAPLLARVAGLSGSVAGAIVRWRDAHGAFANRSQLREVAGLGAKTFEQAAGFLRVRGGDNPLDMTGVHPESYPLVQRMLSVLGRPIEAVMGKADVLRSLKPEAFAEVGVGGAGAITVKDVLAELEKPGRDPRPGFKVAQRSDGVNDIRDLKPGMALQGTVSNVAQFGAFVDLGVHQDGLVHVSQLADRFVRDAREVVKTGDVVNVRVLEVDLARQRIGLTMRTDVRIERAATVTQPASVRATTRSPDRGPAAPRAMAAAFSRLQGKG